MFKKVIGVNRTEAAKQLQSLRMKEEWARNRALKKFKYSNQLELIKYSSINQPKKDIMIKLHSP